MGTRLLRPTGDVSEEGIIVSTKVVKKTPGFAQPVHGSTIAVEIHRQGHDRIVEFLRIAALRTQPTKAHHFVEAIMPGTHGGDAFVISGRHAVSDGTADLQSRQYLVC